MSERSTAERTLDAPWEEWKGTDGVLRFGQFVVNRINIPGLMPDIFYETNHRRAYEKLLAAWPELTKLN